MTRQLLALATLALMAPAALAIQGHSQEFPLVVATRDAASGQMSMAVELEAIQALMPFEQLTLRNVELPTGAQVDVDLTRIDLDRLRLNFFVDGEARADLLDGLDLSLWKGSVVGHPGSEVRLSFSNYGTRGWIAHDGQLNHFMPEEGADGNWLGCKTLVTTENALNQVGKSLGKFCAAEDSLLNYADSFDPRRITPPGTQASAFGFNNGCNSRECTVSMETDYQLYQVFNNLPAETAYLTTLLGYISDRYEEQIDTVLTFPYVMFYTTSSDPWATPDIPGNAVDLLQEFQNAWINNIPMQSELAHFASGASLGGGVAYLDVLGNYSYNFGVSGNIDSDTTFPVAQRPLNWDFIVIAHEMGHNFSAPHTHDYCPPIDECAPAGYFGACQTQQACTSSGTMMSYCHLCITGTANITTYFHPENVARMKSSAELILPLYYERIAGQDLRVVRENAPTLVTAQADDPPNVIGATVMYRYDDGPFLSIPMTDQGGGLYSAQMPPANCAATAYYYFVFESLSCGTGTDPLNAPETTYSAGVGNASVRLAENFESDSGWTVTNMGATAGAWVRGTPSSNVGWPYAPDAAYLGSGQCFVTQNGPNHNDVDNGATQLTSPVFDSTGNPVAIQYAYYLYLSDENDGDNLRVEWSSNGAAGPWKTVAQHETSDVDWRTHIITHAALNAAGASYSANTQVRFVAEDTNASTIVEAGIDAFDVLTIVCTDGGTESYCSTSPNSATSGAVIASVGSVSILGNNFTLVSGAAVPGTPGLFYYGSERVQSPFGDGLRCVGGATQRLFPFVTSSPIGSAIYQLDFTTMPAGSGPNMITFGSTWHFQHWFRDGAAGGTGFNLSNGLSVTFAP